MKIYGKEKRESEQPMLLEEVTVVVTRDEVLDLVRYLSACASDMESNPDWEHVHLRDFLGRGDATPDMVLFAADKVAC